MIETERLQEILDCEAIRDVVAKYFFSVSNRDWPAVLSCFVPGAFADYAFSSERTIEAQLELVKKGISRFNASTLMGSNCSIELGDRRASSRTMALTAHQSPPETSERIRLSAVRYDDEWVQDGNRNWLIARRQLVTIWKAWLDPRYDDRAGDHRNAKDW